MWAQLVNVAIGVWLMAAPAVVDYGGAARVGDRVIGPLIVTFAWVAVHACTRQVRWANAPLGAWLIAAPFVLGYSAVPLANSVLCGVLVVLLARVPGRRTTRFGGGWRVLWDP